jgi:hypothetical protein
MLWAVVSGLDAGRGAERARKEGEAPDRGAVRSHPSDPPGHRSGALGGRLTRLDATLLSLATLTIVVSILN